MAFMEQEPHHDPHTPCGVGVTLAKKVDENLSHTCVQAWKMMIPTISSSHSCLLKAWWPHP